METALLIVDDNEKVCRGLKHNFEQVGYRCVTTGNGKDTVEALAHDKFSSVILDLKLHGEDGISVLTRIVEISPGLPVIILTGFGSIKTAVDAMKLGAFDYLQKPVNFPKLQRVVDNATELYKLRVQNKHLQDKIGDLPVSLVTRNKSVLDAIDTVKKLSGTDLPVLITGESGTGKELFADYIHRESPRRNYRFEKVNCAAFPESLLDNELFGHERGAYTGADKPFEGVFERTHGGTLFLDEIGDMALSIQAKILRALQNKEIRRLGGKENLRVDVRFIAATNKDLPSLIEKNEFRSDLFYRLNAAMIEIPPLRERKEDILPLIQFFLNELVRDTDVKPPALSDHVLSAFDEYDWPGNVRELKNVVNYAGTVCDGDTIRINDLPPYIINSGLGDDPTSPREALEQDMIMKALRQARFNKKRAAELLRMSRKTLYNKLEKYGIEA